MRLSQRFFGLVHGLVLDKCVALFDLYAGELAVWLKVLVQVALARLLHIEINHKQRCGWLDSLPPHVLTPLYLSITLQACRTAGIAREACT